MSEPTFSDTTEAVYRSLPEVQRTEDAAQTRPGDGYPLKRWLSGVVDQLGEVDDVILRADYYTPSDVRFMPDGVSAVNLVTSPRSIGAQSSDGAKWTVTTQVQIEDHPLGIDRGVSVVAIGSFTATLASVYNFDGLAATTDVRKIGVWVWSPVHSVATVSAADDVVTPPAVVAVPAGEWTWVNTVTGGSGNATLTVDAASGVADGNQVVRLAGALASTEDAGSYFDGETTNDERYYHGWTGVTNASTSYRNVRMSDTSDLVDPLTADIEWLPWLGQLTGVQVDSGVINASQRAQVAGGASGFKAGTRPALAAAVATLLTGAKQVAIYTHSTDTNPGGIGTGTQWEVLIVTRGSDTPLTSAQLIAAVIALGAKPAGIKLYHRTVEATWDQLEAAYTTWTGWEKPWQQLEETGS